MCIKKDEEFLPSEMVFSFCPPQQLNYEAKKVFLDLWIVDLKILIQRSKKSFCRT